MARITFYRQRRMDGGYRTGIDIEGDTVFEMFEPGSPESDSALRWYLDLRCDGPSLPCDPDPARQWLLDQTPLIRKGLLACANQLLAGADPDDYPLQWSGFEGVPPGVTMTLAYSAIKRVDAREMGVVLHDVASRWPALLHSVHAAHHVS